jgi:putative membrane protein
MLTSHKIPVSKIVGAVRYELVLTTVYMLAIGALDEIYQVKGMSIPLQIPAILGTAISLMLAFRTNQAYDRWWEARKVWGSIVNDSRTWARQALTFIKNEEAQRKLIMRQIAWNHVLGKSLRKLDASDEINKYLSPDDVKSIKEADNLPNAILALQGRDIRSELEKGSLDSFHHLRLDQTLEKLTDSMGMCERIKNTVFPTLYGLLVHLFIYLFVIILPFGLVEPMGFIEIPLVVGISFIFFSIEKAAKAMQDPFENRPTDTPMTALAINIERDLKQMMKEKEFPEKLKTDRYILM